MICKKCKAEIDGEHAFCPKCGNQVKKKGGAGKMIGLFLPILLICAGVILYVSGFYKHILPQAETPDSERQVTNADIEAETQGSEADMQEMDSKEEETDGQPDEMEKYLDGLLLEPVEMTMGTTFQVEQAQERTEVEWESSDEKVVQVTGGLLKAVTPGNAKITLSAAGKECSFDVTVNELADMTIAVNCSVALEMNDAIPDVRWESSAPEIISVSDGTVSALGTGTATVTAYIGEAPHSFEVVATTPDITTTSVRKIIGNTEQVSILGTNGKVEWKSDNTAIATVSDTGLITAEPTGAGQNTKVHAYVDGMEFQIDVAVEPVPQLSSTYKIYGQNEAVSGRKYTADITVCVNADETVTVNPEVRSHDADFAKVNTVLNVADADYSSGNVYPLYRSFGIPDASYNGKRYDMESHADIYLVGTSQEADVVIQRLGMLSSDGSYVESYAKDDAVVYEACENYGIIHVYASNIKMPDFCLVTVSVDGYTYHFAVGGVEEMTTFKYEGIDELPPKYMIEECVVNEAERPEYVNLDQSAITTKSKTYNPNSEWMSELGGKFVNSLQDQAIDMAAGALLKFIFL